MFDLSPSPTHDDGVRAVLVAASEMLVGGGLGPEYLHNSFNVLGVEGGQFVKVAFSHPPTF